MHDLNCILKTFFLLFKQEILHCLTIEENGIFAYTYFNIQGKTKFFNYAHVNYLFSLLYKNILF